MPGPGGPATTGYSTCGSSLVGSEGVIAPGVTAAGLALVGCGWGDYAQQQFPDIVGNLRVDQAWGSAQVSGAIHQLRANWYGNNTNPAAPSFTGVAPGDAWGWAIAGGIQWNLPWNPGDKFWVEGTYDRGAPSYGGHGFMNGQVYNWTRFSGANVAAGWAMDAVFACNGGTVGVGGVTAQNCNQTGLQLSTSWDVTAALEHYWTPALRTSVWGSYSVWSAGDGNDTMCASPVSVVRTVAGAAPNGAVPLLGCNFGFNVWTVGSRTIWNPVRNLDIGLEVAYLQLNTDMDSGLIRYNFGGSGTRPAGLYAPSNEANWVGMLRVQRNFYP